MVTFKQVLAFPMLLAVVWLTWVFGGQMGTDRMALFLLALVGVAFACWIYGTWGCSFEPKQQKLGTLFAGIALTAALFAGYNASQPAQGAELWMEYSPALVEELKQSGKPFFLDFTADWCTSCKANELVALSGDEVLNKFKELDVTLVKADWTKKDPVITKALAEFGRAGVPLYVLYPGNDKEPQVLPEVLLPSTVLKALENMES
jgi:thiol:disulfide interchange protein DsbD